MKTLLTSAIAGIRERLGDPVRIKRLLEDNPQLRVELEVSPRCIAADSVVRWHELGDSFSAVHRHREVGRLLGWSMRSGQYRSFSVLRPEYAHIGHCAVQEDWACDISAVDGFACSKSDLRSFASTDQMVETNSREMIHALTPEQLQENLAHREIRIIHWPGADHFATHRWDGRVFLINEGGSHHLAAAKYIAARLGQAVPLRGTLKSYVLNAGAVASLRRDYEMFAITCEPLLSMALHEALEAIGATWLHHPLPRPLSNAQAILLPRNEARSMRVAALLRQASIADLGQYLADAAGKVRP